VHWLTRYALSSPRSLRPTTFPYTTLFRSHLGSNTFIIDHATGELVEYSTYQAYGSTESNYRPERWSNFREPYKFTGKEEDVEVRSEEHTSELQSRENLVCRLLLEKKNK